MACFGALRALVTIGLHHDRISLYLSTRMQSAAGHRPALVLPQSLSRLTGPAPMPGMPRELTGRAVSKRYFWLPEWKNAG
jgi:hypothetical protein